jgi:hypothetical protein
MPDFYLNLGGLGQASFGSFIDESFVLIFQLAEVLQRQQGLPVSIPRGGDLTGGGLPLQGLVLLRSSGCRRFADDGAPSRSLSRNAIRLGVFVSHKSDN